ncbi:hypothetical protein DDE05_38005 [Streptomyces cavourensis]|nr:hypothetical protein DDE05_38005 [Streptomyces cavourensis]
MDDLEALTYGLQWRSPFLRVSQELMPSLRSKAKNAFSYGPRCRVKQRFRCYTIGPCIEVLDLAQQLLESLNALNSAANSPGGKFLQAWGRQKSPFFLLDVLSRAGPDLQQTRRQGDDFTACGTNRRAMHRCLIGLQHVPLYL